LLFVAEAGGRSARSPLDDEQWRSPRVSGFEARAIPHAHTGWERHDARVVKEEFTGFAASPDATLAVLDHVNEVTGSAWELVGRLAGGYQAGAWRVEGSDGAPGVLKWWDQAWWATRVLDAAPVVADIRSKGYPTPAWLAVGVTPDNHPYEVQELVQGAAPEGLDVPLAELVVELVQLQRQLKPASNVDWSDYVMRTVFHDPHGRKPRLAALSQEVADALAEADRLVAGDRDVELPDQELVHGDLNVSNLLCENGRITGVVDIEAVGRGTAAVDLLTPARQARLWEGDNAAALLLEETAIEFYGSAVVRVVAACTLIDILTFGADNYPHAHLRAIAVNARSWVDHLRALT
jgi:hypothetical protein